MSAVVRFRREAVLTKLPTEGSRTTARFGASEVESRQRNGMCALQRRKTWTTCRSRRARHPLLSNQLPTTPANNERLAKGEQVVHLPFLPSHSHCRSSTDPLSLLLHLSQYSSSVSFDRVFFYNTGLLATCGRSISPSTPQLRMQVQHVHPSVEVEKSTSASVEDECRELHL
ncbi:hypothetical protein BDN70DRAFT_924311 [Pholiota conissans]|uniref:Uncharacterized protein n=1 Tax=Pholiota conissans TaxID=109636 RepID=A0A9P5YSX1_9AGAR|nr:hypothetical protein BDN70DRAFT_924311 [Pholiota conissans]